MKLIALIALTVTLTASAKSFDLRTYNLAAPIETWVAQATEAGTYDALPELIKKTNAAFKKANYTVDSLERFNEICDLVSKQFRQQLTV